jgi:hypothetical protein
VRVVHRILIVPNGGRLPLQDAHAIPQLFRRRQNGVLRARLLDADYAFPLDRTRNRPLAFKFVIRFDDISTVP